MDSWMDGTEKDHSVRYTLSSCDFRTTFKSLCPIFNKVPETPQVFWPQWHVGAPAVAANVCPLLLKPEMTKSKHKNLASHIKYISMPLSR